MLHGVSEKAMEDESLRKLLLDAPQVMGVESIEVDTVNLRMVARTLPGKQFEVGRRIRVLVVAALIRAGIVTSADTRPWSNTIPSPRHRRPGRSRRRTPRTRPMSFWNWLTRRRDDHGWPGYIINGRIRTSTAALVVAFIAISWVHNTYQPPPARAATAGDPGRAARLHARPGVHLGAAHQRPAAPARRR